MWALRASRFTHYAAHFILSLPTAITAAITTTAALTTITTATTLAATAIATAITTTTTLAAATIATATTTTTTTTIFTRLGFIHAQAAPIDIGTIQPFNSGIGGSVSHFYEAEAPKTAAVTVIDHRD